METTPDLTYVQASILPGLTVHALADQPGARRRMYRGEPAVPGTALCGQIAVDGWFLQGGQFVADGDLVQYVDPAPFEKVTAAEICLHCVELYAKMVS